MLVVVFTIAGLVTFVWVDGGAGMPSPHASAPVLIAPQPGDTRLHFAIDSAKSEVRFVIDEMLLGNPKTVIGTTQQVTGEMLIDLQKPANSLLGEIRINLRTLKTDDEIRNRALRGQILQSNQDEFEFATFVTTRLMGLPEVPIESAPAPFQIAGILTVHGVSREIVFDSEIQTVNAHQLIGKAVASVQYKDFNIVIPEVKGVASIADKVRLEIEFVGAPIE
jgi:polyisoprenoid-binding protein YceI